MTKFADVEDIYKKFPDLKKEHVQQLGSWAKMEPHLPPISELQLILFLHSCHYSNEAAKTCIDNYYTMKALCPEFFANRDPYGKEIASQIPIGLSCVMPQSTPKGYRVVYSNLIDYSPDNYVYASQIKIEDMLIEIVQALNGPANGYIMVIDCKGATIGHLSKFGLVTSKKLVYYLQEAIPLRLLQIHLINVVPLVDMVMQMIRPLLKKELTNKLHFHKNVDGALKYIPKECLPDHVGGSGGNLEQLYDSTIQLLRENVDFLKAEEALIADESKRVGKSRNVGEMFGVEGTFKKLAID